MESKPTEASDHVAADLRMLVSQQPEDCLDIERIQEGKSPQSLDTSLWQAGGLHQQAEQGFGGGVAAVQQEPLRRVSLPAVGTVEGPSRGRPYRACRVSEPVEAFDRPAERGRSGLPCSPARRSMRFCQSTGIHSGCSMTARYISAIQSAPSGPILSMVGRNQLSLEARNSLLASSGARTPRNVKPSGSMTIRWTRLWTGSLTNRLVWKCDPKRSSR